MPSKPDGSIETRHGIKFVLYDDGTWCDDTRDKLFAEPSGTFNATDLAIEAEEIVRTRQRLYEIIAAGTGRELATIEKDCDRNKWLDAPEAIEYGIADTILERVPDGAEG